MTLSTLSRVFHPDDYAHLGDELARVGHARNMFAGTCFFQHPARAWEYSVALAAFGPRQSLRGRRVLEVGCNASPLCGLLAWHGATVVACDLEAQHRAAQEEMGRRAVLPEWSAMPGGSLRFCDRDFADGLPGQFDAVLSVSTIEHCERDDEFFRAMLACVAPGGFLFLTTDFHPSGVVMVPNPGHCRTYNEAALLRLAALAPGFESPGGFDYAWRGPCVGNYTFASLHLRRPA